MSAEQPPRYRFGPRSTRGLIAGWRGGQIACVAVSAVLALGLLRSVSGLAGAAGAFLVAGVGVALAVWPVGGRSVEEWLPTLARFASASLADGRSPPWLAVPRSRRSTLDRLVVRALPHGGERAVGMLEDQEASSWTAVLPVGGVGFALLDEAGQATAVAAWSGVLSAMAAEARDLR
ncbi:MAG: SCO6880 family protein, partial [Acidimicrobiales bacterium]